MIDGGADVIFGAGGLTGNGALEAACQADGVLAIGVDTDQFETLPSVQECIVSSATKNIVEAVKNSLLRIAQDQFTPGFHTDNAATNGIGLAPFHDKEADVPADVKALLDDDVRRPRRRVDQDRRHRRRRDAGPVSRRSVTTHREHERRGPSGPRRSRLSCADRQPDWRRPWPRSRRNPSPPTRLPPPSRRTTGAGARRSITAAEPDAATAAADHRRRRDHDRPGGRGARDRARRSRCAASPSASRASSPTTASTCRSGRARSTPCSARTAPARAR